MISISRYFIKTSILCFSLGMSCGIWQYGHHAFGWETPYTITMAHSHVILIGGMVNMIIGVAVWLFPRSKKGYKFYDPNIIWATYLILTASTITRFCAELLAGITMNQSWLVIGFWTSTIQLITLAVIFSQLWDRVRSKGSYIREAAGETF
jgi:uncharacterized protein involved in response to NO